jgi:twitching motility protein PilT
MYDLPLNEDGSSADHPDVDLNSLLRRVVEVGASDLHLKIDQPPIVRRDGALRPLEGWPPLESEQLLQVTRIIGTSDPVRLAHFDESGEMDTAYQHPGLPRFRVNAFRQRGEISLAFRLIPDDVPTFDRLRLPPGVRRLAEYRQGLILATGATGAGKTTTLASMVGHINRTRRQHIVTIEDPIEILHADENCIINQREVGLDTASFSQALRRALRQDPDVILIGEMRDTETAETALQAAESGHLVLSTMHTVDAAETIRRLIEFFPEAKHAQVRSILAGVLCGVISQRLLPRIDGGRVPAVEVMVNNKRIEELIRENRAEEIPAAIADGEYFDMQTLSQALIDLVVSGDVDKETAAAAAPNRHDFMIALDRALKEHAVQSEEPVRDAEPEEPAVHQEHTLRLDNDLRIA